MALPTKQTITDLSFDSENNKLTLTWDSSEGANYAVLFSTDLINWDHDLNDSVSADAGESTTTTFSLYGLDLPYTVVFRVEKRWDSAPFETNDLSP